MKFNDHERIADFVASRLNLCQEIREALTKGSLAPDKEERYRRMPHHHSREKDIILRIKTAREAFCKQRMIESAENLGRAFHFIADSFITSTSDDDKEHDKEERIISTLPLPESTPSKLEISMEIFNFVKQKIAKKDISIKNKLRESCNVCFSAADSVWRDFSQLTETEKDLLLENYAKNYEEYEEEKSLRDAEIQKLKRIGASSTALMIAIGVTVISYFFYGVTNWFWYAAIISGIVYIIRSDWVKKLSETRNLLSKIYEEKKKYAWYWEHPLIVKEIKEESRRLEVAKQKKATEEEVTKLKVLQPSTQKLSIPSVISPCLSGFLGIISTFLPRHIAVYSIYEAVGVGSLALGIIGILRVSKYSQTLRGKKESIIGIVLGVTLMSINGYFIGLDITNNKILSKSASQKPPIYTTEDKLLLGEKTKAELKEEFKDKAPNSIEKVYKKEKDKSETQEGKPQIPSSILDPNKLYANKTSRTFHRPQCSLLEKDGGLVSFSSYIEAGESGGVPCNLCCKDIDKVRSQKSPISEVPKSYKKKDFITIGSTKEEVAEVLGTPDKISVYEYSEAERWYYGSSYIKFFKGKVYEYYQSTVGKDLKIKISP